jgi:hypothetical protein
MAHPPKADSKRLQQEQRKARLAAELRANLLKRKAQARGRAGQETPGLGSGADPEAEGQE